MNKNQRIKKELNNKLDNYLREHKVIMNHSQATIQNYKYTITRFINWLETNNYYLNQRNVNEIIKRYTFCLDEKISKISTRNRYLIQVKGFLQYLGYRNLKVTLGKDTKNRQPKYLTIEEIEAVIETIEIQNQTDKYRALAIIKTLFNTGLRVSELLNLKKKDIDLKSKEDQTVIRVNGKGNKERNVFINQDTLKSIRTMILKYDNQTEYVFINQYKNQMSTINVNRILKKYAKATDTRILQKDKEKFLNLSKRLTPHSLRHSFTVYLLNDNKIPVNAVKELLGHSSLLSTQIYTKLDTNKTKEMIKEVNFL